MTRFVVAVAGVAMLATSACGHDARAPVVTSDAGSDRAALGPGSDAGVDAGASAGHRVLPSEQDVIARAAIVAPGFRVDHVETRTAPFRSEISVTGGGSGAMCVRVLVAADAPIDVHVEDGSGPRGKEAHGVDAIVPDDGPLCLAPLASQAPHAFVVAGGSANVRFAILVPR